MRRFWRRVPRWALARRATALAFLALLGLGAKAGGTWLVGSTSATTAFGVVPFVDPLAALEVTLATREWMPTVWLGAGGLVVAALVIPFVGRELDLFKGGEEDAGSLGVSGIGSDSDSASRASGPGSGGGSSSVRSCTVTFPRPRASRTSSVSDSSSGAQRSAAA